MRISDWSSDVCSSDLGVKAFSEQAGFGWRDHTTFKLGVAYGLMPGLTVRAGTSLAKRHFGREFVLANVNTPGTSSKSLTFGFTKRLGEPVELPFSADYDLNGKLGRASYRASVCQYVSISLVAVSLT